MKTNTAAAKYLSLTDEPETIAAMAEPVELPPHSLEAEKAVISACMLDDALIPKITKVLHYDQFYSGVNRKYFQVLSEMAADGKKVDIVSLGHQLKRNGIHVDVAELTDYFQASVWTSVKDAVAHAQIVAACAVRRRLCDIGRKLTAMASASKDDAILISDRIKSELDELAKSQPSLTTGPRLVSEGIQAMLARLGDEQPPVISTGLPNYDDLLKGGVRPQELVVICGRPGMGKTAAALGMALHAARKGHGVLFFSMEMSEDALMKRAVSYAGKIPLSNILTNKMADVERREFIKWAGEVESLPMFMDERGGLFLGEIEEQAERVALQFEAQGKKLKVIVVDYLQLIGAPGMSRDSQFHEHVTVVARGLKNLAKKLDVTVIALAQFNRKADTPDAIPSMDWIAGGDEIAKAADNLTFLLPATKTPPLGYGPDEPVKVKFWIQKQRQGPAHTAAYMWFMKPHTRFVPDKGVVFDTESSG